MQVVVKQPDYDFTGGTCYFLLNYAVCPDVEHGWHGVKDAVCRPCYFLLNYAGRQARPACRRRKDIRLAIFFWIMLIPFSWRGKGWCRRVTCYFLLNYACLVEPHRHSVSGPSSLLFSFELCGVANAIGGAVAAGLPCYFLLNYARATWAGLEVERSNSGLTCYFLLNYADEMRVLARALRILCGLAIFFWIMRCQNST